MISPEVRTEVLNRAGGCCEECGGIPTREAGPGSLAVHHLEYRLLDAPENLRVLCARCHGRIHKGPAIYSERISVYLTSEQRALLEALADRWHCPLTEAMRRAVEVAARRERIGGGE